MLLKYLGLPIETSMDYMVACKDMFRCRRCYRGPVTKGVTWPELVRHFISENERFEDLHRMNCERDADVPLRNDHCVTVKIEDIYSLGPDSPVSKPANLKVPIKPISTKGSRYIEISYTWGIEIPAGGYVPLNPDYDEDDDNPVGTSWRDFDYNSADDLMYADFDDVFVAKCKLCARLGVAFAERSYVRLEFHMKMKHGTDPRGNLLPEENANN